MLNNATCFDRIVLVCGYTDLRCGIDGLVSALKSGHDISPFEEKVLFLFCGRSTRKIKGIVFEGDGFLLLYKRLETGRFCWPRTSNEAMNISQEQFEWLMKGLTILPTIGKIQPKQLF